MIGLRGIDKSYTTEDMAAGLQIDDESGSYYMINRATGKCGYK